MNTTASLDAGLLPGKPLADERLSHLHTTRNALPAGNLSSLDIDRFNRGGRS